METEPLKKDELKSADRLLNDPENSARDATIAIALQNPHLGHLNIGNTIVRRDYNEVDEVKLLSGGPSGHEPLYTGFVGKGMLTAAIQGDVFVSPSSYDIMNVIRELSYNKTSGVLVILQNNSGDTLNFGVAVEKCISMGCKVFTLCISDDCSDIPRTYKSDQPRGLTGVVLLIKIAGALIDQGGKTLLEMYNFCEDMQNRINTVILTLKPCTAKNDKSCICVRQGRALEAEIGGGLHGEIGARTIVATTTAKVITELLNEMTKLVTFDETTPFVLMVNNLCVSKLEESIFIGELLCKLYEVKVNIARLYIGTFMSALDMKGFTITILIADEQIISLLDHPTDAPAWNQQIIRPDLSITASLKPQVKPMTHPRLKAAGPSLPEKDSNVLLLVMQFACDALISCERQLNIIDSEIGDGDTGTRIKATAEEILQGLQLKAINLECISVFFRTLSRIMEKIGGTLAALYSLMFEAAGNFMATLDENCSVDSIIWLSCNFHVVSAMKGYLKTEEGGGMLAPLEACAQETNRVLDRGKCNGIEAFGCGVAAAEEAAQKTKPPGMRYADPGAHAVGIWMRAVYEGVKFRCS